MHAVTSNVSNCSNGHDIARRAVITTHKGTFEMNTMEHQVMSLYSALLSLVYQEDRNVAYNAIACTAAMVIVENINPDHLDDALCQFQRQVAETAKMMAVKCEQENRARDEADVH